MRKEETGLRAHAAIQRHSPQVVKSAARVLEIFELFDDLRRDLSVSEVAAYLNYPQSSTSMLMHSLVELGFLRYNNVGRSFSMTQRVALLGTWQQSRLTHQGEAVTVMRQISERTGCIVYLATRSGLMARDIYIIDQTTSSLPITRMDSERSILTTGGGHALLSILPDYQVDQLVKRMHAEKVDPERASRFTTQFVRESIKGIRRRGYCAAAEWRTPGLATLVVPLPQLDRDQPFAVGIRMTADQLRKRLDFFIGIFREELSSLFPISLIEEDSAVT